MNLLVVRFQRLVRAAIGEHHGYLIAWHNGTGQPMSKVEAKLGIG
jgi:hypothetical protein